MAALGVLVPLFMTAPSFLARALERIFWSNFRVFPVTTFAPKEEKIKAIIFRPASPHEQVINMEAKKFDSTELGIRRRREKNILTLFMKREERGIKSERRGGKIEKEVVREDFF